MNRVVDLFRPEPRPARPQLKTDLRIVLASHNKDCGVVPSPIPGRVVSIDPNTGAVSLGVTASDVAFSANPIGALSPISITPVAPGAAGQWQLHPMSALATPAKRQA